MILIINTAPKEYLEIILASKKTDYKSLKIQGGFNQAEKLLPTIDRLLKKQKIKKEQLKGLGVVAGPGGFTAIRIGIAVANVFSYALNLPLVAIKVGEFNDNSGLVGLVFDRIKTTPKAKLVMPIYDREPNITLPKKA